MTPSQHRTRRRPHRPAGAVGLAIGAAMLAGCQTYAVPVAVHETPIHYSYTGPAYPMAAPVAAAPVMAAPVATAPATIGLSPFGGAPTVAAPVAAYPGMAAPVMLMKKTETARTRRPARPVVAQPVAAFPAVTGTVAPAVSVPMYVAPIYRPAGATAPESRKEE